jgi:hypothetical protein
MEESGVNMRTLGVFFSAKSGTISWLSSASQEAAGEQLCVRIKIEEAEIRKGCRVAREVRVGILVTLAGESAIMPAITLCLAKGCEE